MKNKNSKNTHWGTPTVRAGLLACIALVAVAALLLQPAGNTISYLLYNKVVPDKASSGTEAYSTAGLAYTSTMLVKFKRDASAATVDNIHKKHKTLAVRKVDKIGATVVALPDGASVGDSIKQFRSEPGVEYAEPNYIAQRFLTPNDSLYKQQWGLAKIGAPAAWDASQGGYGPIAVVDTGIDASHPDLAGEVAGGYNFVSSSANTSDDNGHGTHVAGIIGAVTNNGGGVASIGFRGTLLAVKVLDATGSGTYANVASGIVYAADKGARIINVSLGGSSSSQTLLAAVNYALQKGSVIVAAAGNNGNNAAVYPAHYAGVIAVGATTPEDNLATYSSFGKNYIAAPGSSITSTYPGARYATLSGTSMAAPEVAGLLGLALAHTPTATSTLLERLRGTSDKVGAYPYDANGWNQYFGYGRINAAKLLGITATSSPSPTPTLSPSPTSSPTSNSRNLRFSVNLDGTVDSIDQSRSVVTVRVKNISRNLEFAGGNLIDLYVTPGTDLTADGASTVLASLKPGDSLKAKAIWQNNQLTATSVTVTSTSPKSNSATGQQTAPGRRRQ